mgnify:CR=1 FL=1
MDEEFFKKLLFVGQDNDDIEEFISLGYFIKSNDTVFRTNKYEEEIVRFIDSKKERLYQAIKGLGSAQDIKKVMELAGIKEFITFSVVAEELVREGKLVKDKEKICIIK